jgi:hypothetical protein
LEFLVFSHESQPVVNRGAQVAACQRRGSTNARNSPGDDAMTIMTMFWEMIKSPENLYGSLSLLSSLFIVIIVIIWVSY